MEPDSDATARLLANLKKHIQGDLSKSRSNGRAPATERREADGAERSAVVEITRHLDGKRETSKGRVVSLSRKMAKLSVPTSLKYAEIIELRMHWQEIGHVLNVEAHVNWVRPCQDDQWTVACSFEAPLSEEDLSRLQANGYVECRREARRAVHVPATAQWQLEREQIPVVIRDYSEGGFCIATERTGVLFQRVLLHLACGDRSFSLIGKVRWQTESQGENLVGCEYVSEDGYRQLHETVSSQDA